MTFEEYFSKLRAKLKPERFYFVLLAIVLALTFGVYFKVLRADFVYDDIGFILNNKDIQSFTPLSKFLISPYIFTGSKYTDNGVGNWANNWRPVASFTFALEYTIFGPHPIGFHLTSIILHLFASALVYLFIIKLTGRYGVALLVTSLWALHPALTEAVSWITNQSSSLFLIFFLLSVLALLYSLKNSNKNRWLLASYGFFSLSLLSKETALAGIFIIPLIYFNYLKEEHSFNFKNFLLKILPFYILGAVYFVARYKIIGALGDHALRGSFWQNLLLAPTVFGKYVSLVFWPKNLLLNYANYPLPTATLDPRVIFGVLLFGIFGFLFWKSFKHPWFFIGFGTTWFLVFLLPVLQFIPFQDVIGERFLYAPLVGLFLALILAFDKLFVFAKSQFSFYPQRGFGLFIKTAAILIILVFSFLTLSRNNDWINSETIWASVLKIDPVNERALGNLAAFYIQKHQAGKVIEISKELLKINPRSIGGHINLGVGFAQAGDLKGAEAEFNLLLSQLPDYKPALFNLSLLYMNTGQYQRAYDILSKLSVRYDYDENIKQNLSIVKNVLHYNGSITPEGVGYDFGADSGSPYIESKLLAPAVSGNVVNSGLNGKVILVSGQPFEAALEVFKDINMSKPFVSVRSDANGNFQIPLRPDSYTIKPANPYNEHSPIRDKYSISINSGQWVQIKIEYQ